MKTKDQPKKQTSRWSKPLIYIIILAAINVFIFSRTSGFDWVNIDDGVLIHENPVIVDATIPLGDVFTAKLFGPHYKPLTFLTWKMQYNSVGNNPGPFHTVNWILHILNAIILFFIGRLLFRQLYENEKVVHISAFLLALFFSVNPLRLESVAWATERKDVLFSLFFLLSWWAYIKYIKKGKYLFLVAGAILYLLSGLSKSMGLTLVAVLFLTDLWFNRKIVVKTIVEKIPYFVSFLTLIYLYGFFGGGSSKGSSNAISETSGTITSLAFIDDLPTFIQLGLSASLRFVMWIVHSFLPFKVAAEYHPDFVFGSFGYATFLFPIIIIALFFFAWKKRNTWKALIGGLLFFTVTISPVLAYTQSGQAAFMADRYTYIPCIGLFLAAIYFLNKLRKNQAKYNIIVGVIALIFIVSSALNIDNWKNSEALFSQVIEVNDKSSLGYLNLGRFHRENGNAARAMQIYTRGISMASSPELYSNRGKIYFDQRNYDQALIDFNKSLNMNPDYPEALANRAGVYGLRQQWDLCFADLNKALSIDDDSKNALHNRGIAHFQQGNYKEASEDFSNYVKQDPTNANIINTLGLSLARIGKHNEAIQHYNRSIRINSGVSAYFYNRSLSYKALGNKSNALKDAQRAQQMGYTVTQEYLNSLN